MIAITKKKPSPSRHKQISTADLLKFLEGFETLPQKYAAGGRVDGNLPKGPDWRKALEKTMLFPEVALRTVLPESSVFPPNAKALARYLSGDKTPLDDADVRAMEGPILDAIMKAKSEGRNYVKYEDYGQGARNNTSDISEMGVLKGSGIPATTLGRFNFLENEDGSFEIKDTYNFDDKEQSRSRLSNELGVDTDASPYEVFRASQEGKGFNVSDLYQSTRNAVSFYNPSQDIQEQSFTLRPQGNTLRPQGNLQKTKVKMR